MKLRLSILRRHALLLGLPLILLIALGSRDVGPRGRPLAHIVALPTSSDPSVGGPKPRVETSSEAEPRAIHLTDQPGSVSFGVRLHRAPPAGGRIFVFAHLLDENDRTVRNLDRELGPWWPDRVLPIELEVDPEGLDPGEYRLVTGVWVPKTGARIGLDSPLPALDDDRVLLARVSLEQPGSRSSRAG